ncbi:MAG: adenylate kinase [Patescibacteria group bacterium]|jgi:adenylate kinase
MDKTIICLFGPQGSGKGTQAKILNKKFNIPHISMGDLFRLAIESETEMGKEVEEIINRGGLVPDEMTFSLLRERVSNSDCAAGFILDGYPRTLRQANMLDEYVEIDKLIVINISDEEAVKRLTSRRHCLSCGAIYNLYTSPKPKDGETCDQCHKKLHQRDDDKEDAIRARLNNYHKETEEVIKYYGEKAIKINGEQEIEKVASDIEIEVSPYVSK